MFEEKGSADVRYCRQTSPEHLDKSPYEGYLARAVNAIQQSVADRVVPDAGVFGGPAQLAGQTAGIGGEHGAVMALGGRRAARSHRPPALRPPVPGYGVLSQSGIQSNHHAPSDRAAASRLTTAPAMRLGSSRSSASRGDLFARIRRVRR